MADAVGAVGSQGVPYVAQPHGADGALMSFLDRASLCGDMTSALMSLTSQDDALSSATQRKQLNIRRRLVDDAHVRRQEELEKYYKALKRSSFWSKLGSIFGGVCSALAVVTGGIFGVASLVPLAIGATGTLGAGGARLGAAEWNRKATKAKTGELQQQLTIDQGKQIMDQILDDIKKAAEIESGMISRLARLADSERNFSIK